MAATPWERWLDRALSSLADAALLRSIRPLLLQPSPVPASTSSLSEPLLSAGPSGCAEAFTFSDDFQTFDGPGPWDRASVEVEISRGTLERWQDGVPSAGEEVSNSDLALEYVSGLNAEFSHKLVLFSSNDYLGLSSHPAVRRASSKAALEFGMGPRGSALICGYTYFHRSLESALADLKRTEDCLLCPTGFAANMAVMTTIASTFPQSGNLGKESSIAIFSDSLNHASIVDGIRLARRQSKVEFEIYRHCDVDHLNQLLLNCKHDRKAVVTDSLFSMDGDFAPIVELVALRKKHDFLLVVDDAHGTLVCGETGGGVAEAFNVEGELDIVVGTLSKAIGCQGGFIACSRKWKQLILSRGRSYVYSTALSVPLVAGAHAALAVAREEKWRRKALWERVNQLAIATGSQFVSPIAPVIIGGEEEALQASRSLMLAGFHVTAIRPPTVPKHSSRLRITLSAAHSPEHVKALAVALMPWLKKKQGSQPPLAKVSDSFGEASSPRQSEEKFLHKSETCFSVQDCLTEDIRAKL